MPIPLDKILKKHAKIKARKLTKKDVSLIEKTIEEQKRILDLLNVPYEILNNRITI